MKSKSAALIKLFHQLPDTQEPEKIQDLLDRIHRLNSQLTFDQRMRVYDTVLQEARERAVRDVAAQGLDAAAQAILDELDTIKSKAFMLVPVSKAAADKVQECLRAHISKLSGEEDPRRIHQVIQTAVQELESLPDRNLRSWGYHLLRENLEVHILSAYMDREEESPSLTLFCALYLTSLPALALSLLRYSSDYRYYWIVGSRELAEAESLTDLKRELQAYRDIIHYATAQEAAEYVAQLRWDIVYRLLGWVSETGQMHDPDVAACTNSLSEICFRKPNLSGNLVPTYRAANVLYSTMCLCTEEQRDTFRAAVEDQGGLMDMCPSLYGPLYDFTLFSLVLRLYQAMENTGAVMTPVVECLFRLYLGLSLTDSAITEEKIYAWVMEVSE